MNFNPGESLIDADGSRPDAWTKATGQKMYTADSFASNMVKES
jgi:hypothetical protein